MISNLLRLGGYLLLAREAADFMASANDFRHHELQRRKVSCAVTGTLVGLSAGLTLGVLFAPRAGKETREIISTRAGEMIDALQHDLEAKKQSVGEYISGKKEEFCAEPEDADKEVVV